MRPRGGAAFLLFFGGRGFAAPFRSAGGCFLIRGGLSAALPPFRLCEQREHFSCSPFFPYHGEERTICLPSRPNFLFPLSPIRNEERTFYVSPSVRRRGYLVFCPPSPFRGREKRFPGTKKRSWSFGQNKRPASNGNEPEKIKATPSAARPHERARGTSLREGGTGVLTRPSDQMRSEARRSLPRSKILASFSSVSSMTGSSAFVFLEASLL